MNEEELKNIFWQVPDGGAEKKNHPGQEAVLIISPHPDDDVLAAGGTMASFSAEGRRVYSVYVTDGRGSPRLDPAITDEEMAARREAEARESLTAVKAVGGFFLRRTSAELRKEEGWKVKDTLGEILDLIDPALVLIPAPFERHATHQVCTRSALAALRDKSCIPLLYGYSLWGAFWGSKRRIVQDVSDFISLKKKAVAAHRSQLEYKHYLEGILGKNRYEAVFWESHGVQKSEFVEIFLDMTELLCRPELTLEEFIREDVEGLLRAIS